MAYLSHPYSPIIENLKVFTGEIKESNVEETGDIAYKIMSKYPNLTVLSRSMLIHSWKVKIWKKRIFSDTILDFSTTAPS
ncbi:MAG: hypothetical protein ACLU45_02000 [Dialister invisus]|uniref:hypothetical protein n=1 Tax=Dialister invisus TaxID=218538 RepID=UPI00399BAA81